jgi:hypothetical protein
MRYTTHTIVLSKSRFSESEARVARQRKVVEHLESSGQSAEHAAGLLMVMEQNLLSMRLIATLEQDLERSLEKAEQPARRQAEHRKAPAAKRDISRPL